MKFHLSGRNNVNWRIRKLKFVSWLKFLLIVTGVAGILFGLFFGYKQLKVIKFVCETQYGDCPPEILDWLGKETNKPLFGVWSKLGNELSYAFPYVSQIKLKLLSYNEISLLLFIERPTAVVSTKRLEEENSYFLVNIDGYLIDDVVQPGLPKVILDQLSTGLRDKLPDNQLTAVLLVDKLHSLGYLLTAAQTDDFTLEVKLQSGEVVFFPLESQTDVARLVSALQVILAQAKIDSSKEQIDLRYKQPLIRDLTILKSTPAVASKSAESQEVQNGVGD